MKSIALRKSFHGFLLFIALAGVFVEAGEQRSSELQWENVWPMKPFLQGWVYSVDDAAYLVTEDTAWITRDGLTWNTVDDVASVPEDPNLTRRMVVTNRAVVPDGGPPQLTTVTISDEPTGQRTPSHQDVAVWHEGAWWIQVGPFSEIYRSSDGVNWQNADLPFTGGEDGGFNLSPRLLTINGDLFFVKTISEFPPYNPRSGGGKNTRRARVFVLGENEWTFLGSVKLSPSDVGSADLIQLNDRLYVVGNNRSYALEPEDADPEADSFGRDARFVGFLGNAYFVMAGDNGRGDLFVTHSDLEGLPQKLSAPPTGERAVYAAFGEFILAATADGKAWRRTLTSEWETVGENLSWKDEWITSFAFRDGRFRLTTDSFSLVTDSGEEWSQSPSALPAPDASFSAHGFLADQPSGDESEMDKTWSWSDLYGWQYLGEFRRSARRLHVPEIGLTEIITWDMHHFFAVKPGGQLVHWTTEVQWTETPLFNQPTPTTAHAALAYGHGLLAGGRSQVADTRLRFTRPSLDSFQSAIFHEDRFWGEDWGMLYRSSAVKPYPFEGAKILNHGWEISEWFGWVNTTHYPWAYRLHVGWTYVWGPLKNNCWLWDDTVGWYWTNQYYWPLIWTPDAGWQTHPLMQGE